MNFRASATSPFRQQSLDGSLSPMKSGKKIFLFLLCACTPGSVEPQAMSAAEHQAAADREERAAQEHPSRFSPGESRAEKECIAQGGGKEGGPVCWVNPTPKHSAAARHHRDLERMHREAALELQNAEASACSGIDTDDRETSPFEHLEDIRSVSALDEPDNAERASRVAGATVVFRAVPGMTVEWLQRVVDCHLARNAALGYEEAALEMTSCPLTVRGAKAMARPISQGFAVTIRADEDEASREILRRAQSLTNGAAGAP